MAMRSTMMIFDLAIHAPSAAVILPPLLVLAEAPQHVGAAMLRAFVVGRPAVASDVSNLRSSRR
jgi:hypothetical protein